MISFVQGNTGTVVSPVGYNISVPFLSNNISGNCIVVDVVTLKPIFPGSLTISDSNSNVYTLVDSLTYGTGYLYATYVASNITSGANTVTLTWPGFSSTGNFNAAIQEYSGVVTISPIDTHSTASGSTTLSPSVTTTQSGDLIHLLASDQSSVVLSQSGGYTSRETSTLGSNSVLYTWDYAAGSPGSYSNTVSGFSSGVSSGAIMTALKSVSGGSSFIKINPGMDGGMVPQLKGGMNG